MSQKTIKLKGGVFFKPKFRDKLQEAVYVSHDITHRSSLILKSYYLRKHASDPLNTIEVDFELIKSAFDVVQSSPEKTRPQIRKARKEENNESKAINDEKKIRQFNDLKVCYESLFGTHYIQTKLSLSHILSYKMKLLETCYINNIVFHYPKYVMRLLRCDFGLTKKLSKVVFAKLVSKSQDIENVYVNWCLHNAPLLLSERPGNLENYIETKPWNFLKEMVVISQRTEAHYINNPEERKRLYNPFPFVSTFIPSHIHLDTSGVVQLLMESKDIEDFKNVYELNYNIKLKVNGKDDILKSYEKLTGEKDPDGRKGAIHNTRIWEYLCCFDNKKYKKVLSEKRNDGTVWVFDNSVKTDGVSISISLTPEDNKKKKKMNTRKCFHKKKENEFLTIDDLTPEEKEDFLRSKKATVDPGKGNLAQISDGLRTFRYTSAQRRDDMKQKKLERKGNANII